MKISAESNNHKSKKKGATLKPGGAKSKKKVLHLSAHANTGVPWILVRSISTLLNISIAYATIYVIFPFVSETNPELIDQFNLISALTFKEISTILAMSELLPVVELVNPYWTLVAGNFSNAGQNVITFLIIYFAIDFVSHFRFGTNVGFTIARIKTEDSGVIKRIRGCLRSTIGMMTAPLIIFDLPVIIKKRSFKEFITGTRFSVPTAVQLFIPTAVLIPLFSAVALFSPLLLEIKNLNGTTLSIKNAPKVEPLNSNFQAKSSYFMMDINTTIPESWTLMPRFKKESHRSSKQLDIIDTKQGQTVTFSLMPPANLKSLISQAKIGNPLFPIFYPVLNKVTLSDNSSIAFSKKAIEEITALVESTLSVSPKTIHNVILKNGPFLAGNLKLREKLFQLFDINSTTVVTLLNINNRQFLEAVDADKTTATHKFIPLDAPEIEAYRFTYKSKENKLAEDVIAALIYPSKFFIKRNSPAFDDVRTSFINRPNWDAFMVLDFFTEEHSLPPRFNSGLENFYKHALAKNRDNSSSKKFVEEAIYEIMSKDSSVDHPAVEKLITRMKSFLGADTQIIGKKNNNEIAENVSTKTQRKPATKFLKKNQSVLEASRKLTPPKFN